MYGGYPPYFHCKIFDIIDWPIVNVMVIETVYHRHNTRVLLGAIDKIIPLQYCTTVHSQYLESFLALIRSQFSLFRFHNVITVAIRIVAVLLSCGDGVSCMVRIKS